MKKLLIILGLLITLGAGAQVKVLGYVVPNSTSDNYPTHLDIYGAGGFRSVATLAERDAISALRRRAGMLVYVVANSATYQLGNDLTTWSAPSIGGGGGGVSLDSMVRLIQANSKRYYAGWGLILNDSIFRVDTTLLAAAGIGSGGGGGGGGGTVTSFSFVNGFGVTGTVTNPFTTPSLTAKVDTSVIVTNNRLTTVVNTLNQTIKDSSTSVRNGGGVTSVSATGTSGVIASVTNPTTTPAITIRADTAFLSTKSYTNTVVNNRIANVLPYNADSSFYLGGDTTLHRLPVAPPVSDSIDYAFTAMTTVYNEAGPGEYSVSPHGLTANKDNFTAPFRQLKSLDIGGWTDGDYISFTNATISSSTNFTFLRAFIRLKSVVPVAETISFAFYYNGNQVSKTISCVNYGIDKNKVGVYQNVSIPFSAFGFTSNNFDELRLKFGGTQSDGIYMDLVQFQNASVFENTFITDVFKKPLTDSVFKVVGGINVFAYRDSAGSVGGGGDALLSNYIVSEVLSGTVNGTNKVFTFANAIVANKEMIFLNGVKQKRGTDYTMTNTTTATFITAPITDTDGNDYLEATYFKQ